MLKEREYPDTDPNVDDEKEMNRHKFFKPRLISASGWTTDNYLRTTLEHCNSDMHVHDVFNATSINNCLFSNIRKVHYFFVLQELTLRGGTLERAKLNSKVKEVNVGIEARVTILISVSHPNEIEKSENMIRSERAMFKSFKPTYLSYSKWTSLLNVSNNPNPIAQE